MYIVYCINWFHFNTVFSYPAILLDRVNFHESVRAKKKILHRLQNKIPRIIKIAKYSNQNSVKAKLHCVFF